MFTSTLGAEGRLIRASPRRFWLLSVTESAVTLPPNFGSNIMSNNTILASLSHADAAALKPHLKPVYLEQQRILYETGDTIDTVYFPTSSIVSIVVGLSTGETVEAAMIGKDGVVGAAAGLDARLSMEPRDCAVIWCCHLLRDTCAEKHGIAKQRFSVEADST